MDVEWEKPEQAEGNITGYKVICLQKGEESIEPKLADEFQYSAGNVWQGLDKQNGYYTMWHCSHELHSVLLPAPISLKMLLFVTLSIRSIKNLLKLSYNVKFN